MIYKNNSHGLTGYTGFGFGSPASCNRGHPQARNGSSPEPASGAATSRAVNPVHPVHPCSQKKSIPGADRPPHRISLRFPARPCTSRLVIYKNNSHGLTGYTGFGFGSPASCNPGHPQARNGSSPEPASGAAASRAVNPVHPVHPCSQKKSIPGADRLPHRISLRFPARACNSRLVIYRDSSHGWTGNTALSLGASCNPGHHLNGLFTSMHRMHRIFSGNG